MAEGVGLESTMKLTPHSGFQDGLQTCRPVSPGIVSGRLCRLAPLLHADWCRLMLLLTTLSVSIACPSSAVLGLPDGCLRRLPCRPAWPRQRESRVPRRTRRSASSSAAFGKARASWLLATPMASQSRRHLYASPDAAEIRTGLRVVADPQPLRHGPYDRSVNSRRSSAVSSMRPARALQHQDGP